MSWDNAGSAGGGWNAAGASTTFEEPAPAGDFAVGGDEIGNFRGEVAGFPGGGAGGGGGCYNW